jgi:hypothetical protein
MGAREVVRKIAAAAVLMMGTVWASVCQANCQPGVYVYEDRVAQFGCTTPTGTEVHVIVLDEANPLKVAGHVASSAPRNFDAANNYKNFILTVTWNKLEVFDLSDPANPKLAANFELKEQEKLTGYPHIENSGTDKFLVLSPIGAHELTTQGEPAKWVVREIPLTPELRKKGQTPPPELRFSDENTKLTVVRETDQFRYELVWREKSKPGEILHREYLRKVDKKTQRSVSELLLAEHLETID